ncbi:beta strand repeat-containing protein, partial [Veillonella atypica]|uniref:beta strand repeat-containing protein n=1 Tax=Veillonella atypica TaxID=39777 RepID=UPI00352DE33C
DSVTANNRVTVGSGANAINLNGATGAITGKTATIGGVTVNGTANTIGGLSNTTWNGTATTGRAATEDQLKAVADSASSQKWKITADKTGTLSNQTGTKKEATVGKDETVELVAGDNLTIDQNERKFTYSLNKELKGLTSVGIGNGTTQTITLNGANKTAIIGGITVDGTNNFVTGLANTTWNGTATTGRAATEDQLKSVADAAKSNTDAVALKFTGDVAANTGTVNLKDDTFGIKGDGKYISTDVNGNNVKLTVSEAAVKKSAVAAVTVSTDTNDTNNPLTVRSIPGTDGTTMEYKVTIDGTKIANKTHLSYKANNGTAKQVSLADGLDFTNGTMTTATIDDKGVVKYSVNTVTITAGTDGTITAPTADGVATAKNVADAINVAKKASTTVLTANGGEGANATTGNVTLTSTTEADGHTKYDVKLNNKVTLGTGANAVTIDGTAGKATIGTSVIDGVNNTFTTGGTHSVNVDGSTGTVTGLTNTTWNGTATTGRAATEDQLKAVADQASKNAAASTTEVTVNGGNQANVTSGNLLLAKTKDSTDGHTKFDIKLNDKVEFGTGNDKITVDGTSGIITTKNINASGDVNAKNVTTTADVTAGGTVTGSTLKAGNVTVSGTTNTITGLSNTTWNGITTTPNRAATESQLQQAISSVASSATFKFDGDNNSQQTMNLQNGTFNVTGDTMITTNATSTGVRLLLNTNNVKIAYAANGTNGQTTSLASGFNFKDGAHTKATVDSNGVVKYNAQTSTISVANGHATASGNDLATADNVADAINQMTQNNSGNTTQLRQEISKVATETQRVGAHAAAMAALKPIQYDPLAPTQIMAGVGNYRGESAAALGIAHYTNDNTMFNVGVSVGGNHNMINAGVTHKFGISAEKKNIPDRYKAGPISSIYVMQDEMTQLRSENEAYKAKLDKQQSEIDALKAAVDQLLASKA